MKWQESSIVAFDIETSGAYPIGYDIIEFGAVKWHKGREIDKIQIRFKPREVMSDYIIKIHSITNEMVQDAPLFNTKIQEIWNFINGSVLIAHHAPFDLGFLTLEFEKNKMDFPQCELLCSSLISRKVIKGTKNHKLQTLVQYLGIDGGAAHRALDDARSCLNVALACFQIIGTEAELTELEEVQGKKLSWRDYTLLKADNLDSKKTLKIMEAIHTKADITFIYLKGSRKGERRAVRPIGIVRNPDGDYLYALCLREGVNKRYYLNSIEEID